LLGFDGIVENSYDAVASRDFVPESASALAILMTTLSRMAEDLIIWNTVEFSTLDMPEDFSITSSIMPQKKNPFVLEHIKGRTGHVIAAVTSALTVLKGTSFSHNREVGGETASLIHNTFGLVQGCLEMMTYLVPSLSFDEALMKERTLQGFSTVTQLADLLVYKKDIPFRQAHQIIGKVVNELLDKRWGVEKLSSNMIDQASEEILGRDLHLPEEDIKKALDPYLNVLSREVLGGPGPISMGTLIGHQTEELRQTEKWLSRQRSALEKARETCEQAELELTSASAEKRT
jgi:argininosuccinate lyase